MHPSILYHRTGLPIPDDCYSVSGIPRSLVKVTLLTIINAKGVAEARPSLQSEVNYQNIQLPKRMKVVDVITSVVEKHKAIQDYFFKSKGLFLQGQESRVTAKILKHFTNRGIVVMPVHDSFIVEENYQHTLQDVMRVEFYRQFGFFPQID
jgi:hypothetical protein